MKQICAITGSRADYGLLRPIMNAIRQDPTLKLQVVVTGMHLSPEFGFTVSEIEADGFAVDQKVEILLSSDSSMATAKSMGLGMISFAECYHRLKPDVVLVLDIRPSGQKIRGHPRGRYGQIPRQLPGIHVQIFGRQLPGHKGQGIEQNFFLTDQQRHLSPYFSQGLPLL